MCKTYMTWRLGVLEECLTLMTASKWLRTRPTVSWGNKSWASNWGNQGKRRNWQREVKKRITPDNFTQRALSFEYESLARAGFSVNAHLPNLRQYTLLAHVSSQNLCPLQWLSLQAVQNSCPVWNCLETQRSLIYFLKYFILWEFCRTCFNNIPPIHLKSTPFPSPPKFMFVFFLNPSRPVSAVQIFLGELLSTSAWSVH